MLDLMILKILMPFVVVLVVRSVLVMVFVNYIKEMDIPMLKEIMTNGTLVSTLSLFTLSVAAWTINHALVINDRLTKALFKARNILPVVLGSSGDDEYKRALVIARNQANESITRDITLAHEHRSSFYLCMHPRANKKSRGVGAAAEPRSRSTSSRGAMGSESDDDKDDETGALVSGRARPLRTSLGCLCWPVTWVLGTVWRVVYMGVVIGLRVAKLILKATFFVDTSLSVTSPAATGLGMYPDEFISHVTSICAERVDTGVSGRALS